MAERALRTVAVPSLPTVTPVRRRAEVRRFLNDLDPALIEMLDGIYELRDRTNGTCASAFSATELLKLMIFTLVTHADVKRYARETYGTGTQKRHALELIAINYSADVLILMALTHQGDLADDLQYIKHYGRVMGPAAARRRLLELTEDLEGLLVYLAQTIGR